MEGTALNTEYGLKHRINKDALARGVTLVEEKRYSMQIATVYKLYALPYFDILSLF